MDGATRQTIKHRYTNRARCKCRVGCKALRVLWHHGVCAMGARVDIVCTRARPSEQSRERASE
eukprot:1088890-Alexandrium_andersonii.AAC.1